MPVSTSTDTIKDFETELRARRARAAERDRKIEDALARLRDCDSSLRALQDRLAEREATAKARRESGKSLDTQLNELRQQAARELSRSEQVDLRTQTCAISRSNLPATCRTIAAVKELAAVWTDACDIDKTAIAELKSEVAGAEKRRGAVQKELAELES